MYSANRARASDRERENIDRSRRDQVTQGAFGAAMTHLDRDRDPSRPVTLDRAGTVVQTVLVSPTPSVQHESEGPEASPGDRVDRSHHAHLVAMTGHEDVEQ